MHNVLIFGGTFDPVHKGHIQIAMNVQQHCNFDRCIFLPCKLPLLKKNPDASPEQRVKMLELALSEIPGKYHCEIDQREIMRETPSYMVTSLADFRAELGHKASITLLLGTDTLATLTNWYQWEKLIELANLLIINRPGFADYSERIKQFLEKYESLRLEDLKTHSHGYIYRLNVGDYEEASTKIREQLHHQGLDSGMLAEKVKTYIQKEGLYAK